eukprot:TRINITY_DN355_c0_g1_i3.p1 TRINITY_DN355_c0_g1~~TRINITY_DN355_c0_g1_i3.p1  ORF type:complete len:249 (+),score=51.89 TRINITY_DN355_c0_g1_i3:61-807(+)
MTHSEHATQAERERGAVDARGAEPVPLTVVKSTHRATRATRALCRSIGGAATLERMTSRFYTRMFADPHLDQFVANREDPHPARLATWIAEKMGDGEPWSRERETRPQCPVMLAGGRRHIVHDRSSAHAAAWYSPKRDPAVVGQHFQLDDCRVWMRLMFWSARDLGLLDHPQFGEWFVRFIGHFVRVYERSAPAFARESARWSADPANVQRYRDAGRRMTDVIGKRYSRAIAELPAEEQAEVGAWPYE